MQLGRVVAVGVWAAGLVVGAGCATRAGTSSLAEAPAPAVAPVDGRQLERHVAAHLRFLASDALNGRGSGTRDEWIAATYIASQLEVIGLEPMGDDGWFVQRIEVQRFTARVPPVLTAGDRAFTRGTDFLVTSVGGARVGGALARFVPGTPVTPGSTLLVPADTPPATLGQTTGAALVLRRASEADMRRMTTPVPARATIASQIVGTPAAPGSATFVTLAPAAFDAVAALADGTAVRLDTDLEPTDRTSTWNVVGRLAGSDPSAASEAVILSAHLDHIGARHASAGDVTDVINNGADDDASGVAAVIEVTRALAAGPRPRRPVVVALFGSEEAGGFGARYFVERPVVPLTDIVADLQIEMIGRPDAMVPAGTLWLTGYERSTLGAQLAARGARLVADPRPDQRFFERSDNIRFARRGVVAHTVSSFGLHGEYHQPSDEFRHINLAHMRDAIASLVEPVRWLATTTERPVWNPGGKP